MSSVATSPDSVGDEELLEVSKWIHSHLQKAVDFSYEGRCADSYVAFVKQATQVEEAIKDGFGCVTNKSVDCAQSSVQISSPSPHRCDEEVQITVTTKNADGNDVTGSLAELGLTVEVTDPNHVPHIVKGTRPSGNEDSSHRSSSHSVRYRPTIAGEHTISVAIGDQPLSGSPLSIPVNPPKLKFARNQGRLQDVSFQSDESVTAKGQCTVKDGSVSGSGPSAELCVVDTQDRVRLLIPLQLTFSAAPWYSSHNCEASLKVQVKAYTPG